MNFLHFQDTIVLLIIFCGNCDNPPPPLQNDEYKVQKQHYFEIKIFCYIINVFTLTFGQFTLHTIKKLTESNNVGSV